MSAATPQQRPSFPGAASVLPSLAAMVHGSRPVVGPRPAVMLATSPSTGQPDADAPPPVKIPLPAKLVVGAVAGVLGTCGAFPFDMVKTRLQNQKVGPNGERAYRSAFHCASTIIRTEGWRGLYKGLGANVIGVAPEKAIKLTINDLMRERLGNADGSISVGAEAISGATAGFFQNAATNPMEIVKIRMQLNALQPPEQRKTTMQIVRHLGIRGLYHGAGATWLRDVPYSILFFPGYAHMKHLVVGDRREGSAAYIAAVFVAGGGAAAMAAGACTPMDVIKTRLQVPGARKLYTGIGHCATTIWKNEGASAFFKGIVPRMVVQTPLFGIALVAFELQKNYMRKKLNE